MAAAFITNLIRYKQEGYKPDRDIIIALETDEEIFDRDSVGIQWLIKNHRDLIDAEYALNGDGGDGVLDEQTGAAKAFYVQGAEKTYADFELTVTNPGGHSSMPRPDNADSVTIVTPLHCTRLVSMVSCLATRRS